MLSLEGFIKYLDATDMKIVENYYGSTSDGERKFYSSNVIFDGHFKGNSMKVDFQRPFDGRGTKYYMIERIVLLKSNPLIPLEITNIDLRDYWNNHHGK